MLTTIEVGHHLYHPLMLTERSGEGKQFVTENGRKNQQRFCLLKYPSPRVQTAKCGMKKQLKWNIRPSK